MLGDLRAARFARPLAALIDLIAWVRLEEEFVLSNRIQRLAQGMLDMATGVDNKFD